VDVFGTRGSAMVRFLNVGTKGLKESEAAAVSLGLALDKKTIAGIDRAGDAFLRFKFAVSGIFRSLAAEIAPYVEVLSNKMTAFLAEGARGQTAGAKIADFIIAAVGKMGDAIQSMANAAIDFYNWARGSHWNMWTGFFGNSPSKTGAPHGATGSWDIDFSSWLQSQVAGIKASEQGGSGTRFGGFLGTLFKKAKNRFGPGLSSIGQILGKGVLGVGQGINAFPGLLMQGFLQSQLFQANHWQQFAKNKPALTFAESGSAESYRQQAAMRRENEKLKLDQHRNSVLDKILLAVKDGPLAVKDGPVLKAPGLGG
jgi:hypothetical protein